MAKSSTHLHTLYCGTSERIAKLSPRVGLNPNQKPVYLTDVYPGVFAFFASTNDNDRFGILEIDLSGDTLLHFKKGQGDLRYTIRKPRKRRGYCGLGSAAMASRNVARLLLSTTALPVSTQLGEGGGGAVRQSLNSFTALWCRSSRNFRP